MKLSSLALQWATTLSLLGTVAADPRVKLGYATYEGTSLNNGVNQFLGMRYAAPPLGDNRFRRAKEPIREKHVIQAKEHGPVCYGVQGLAFGSVPVPLSEDCLFIDVYAPSDATDSELGGLPVMLWLQGGAFVQLFNPNYNGTGLIEASGGRVIVATFNYRTGPFGFLASKELQDEGNLNIGLQDQRAAIGWVQKHISKFGGDPERITLFGTSVGGGSVLLQTLAYGGNPPKDEDVNWRAGIAAATYVPPFRHVQDVEFQYNQLLNATGCDNLACLRSLNSSVVQAANLGRTAPGQANLPLFPAGNFSKHRPLIVGSSHSEGTLFAPQANTTKDISSFLKTQYPDLTNAQLNKAEDLYSCVPETYPGVNVSVSPLHYRAAQMYGDAGYTCPALNFASGLSAAGVDIFLFRDNIIDAAEEAAGYIVPHTWETQAVWGPEYATSYVALPGATSYNAGGANRRIVGQVQKYWTDFALAKGSLDSIRGDGHPKWKKYGKGRRLRLQTNETAMEPVEAYEHARCNFWEDISPSMHM
ncbi:hypothetical protein MRS44_005482 [Fusarium solani]|uniref:uncharacterized protein n=1 Tax=Fusarium solani TaxID=169388 RepID=UPI0032C421C9|nr:hypothetical protein MRS44_005482 [Fusarium solani]